MIKTLAPAAASTLPTLTVKETLGVIAGVVLPNLLKGVIIRRPSGLTSISARCGGCSGCAPATATARCCCVFLSDLRR
jgi:hypothetical protein